MSEEAEIAEERRMATEFKLLGVYYCVYASGYYLLRLWLNSEEMKDVHGPVVDVARDNLASGAGASFYCSMAYLAQWAFDLDKKLPITLTQNQKKAFTAASIYAALTLVEIQTAAERNSEFDKGDMMAYLVGICVFYFAEPLINKLQNSWAARAENSKEAKSLDDNRGR